MLQTRSVRRRMDEEEHRNQKADHVQPDRRKMTLGATSGRSKAFWWFALPATRTHLAAKTAIDGMEYRRD